jgi:hypothetical protein
VVFLGAQQNQDPSEFAGPGLDIARALYRGAGLAHRRVCGV